MKKGALITTVLASLFSINFISAYYGSYYGFSLSNLLGSIDSSTMLLGVIFIITFAVANYALARVFKGNKGVAGVSALAIAILVIWEVNARGWANNLESMFYGFGVPEGLLSTLLPLVIVGILIYLIVNRKIRLAPTLIGIGSILILIAVFTDWVYEKGLVVFFGIIALGIGIWLGRKKNPPKGKPNVRAADDY